MLYLILAVALLILLLLAYMHRKIQRIDENTWRFKSWLDATLKNEYCQIEALLSLQKELSLDHSLPAMRNWAGSPDFLLFLAKKSLRERPKTIVECSSGVSTIVLARCAQIKGIGHVYSLEHESLYAQQTRYELQRHGLEEWATVLDAPLCTVETRYGKQKWYDTSSLQVDEIDMLVIDGPPESTNPMARFPAGKKLFPRMSVSGSIVLDDAQRPDEKEAISNWLLAFPELSVEWKSAEKGIAILSSSTSTESDKLLYVHH